MVNLYGSVPRTDSVSTPGILTVLKDFIANHAHLNNVLRCLNIDDIMNLISMVINSDYVLMHGSTYLQCNGLAMGNPISPQLVIIYKDYIEKRILDRLPSNVVWKRYIDDIWIVWPADLSCDDLLSICNSVSSSIQFKIELPNSENFLPFLDCEIQLNTDNNSFPSRLYAKPIHSGSILPWNSGGPISQKRSVLISELIRAERRSSNKQNTEYSINIVISRFI